VARHAVLHASKEGTQSLEDLFESSAASQQIQEWQVNPFSPKSLLDRVSTGSDSDLVSDRHAIFAKGLDSDAWTRPEN